MTQQQQGTFLAKEQNKVTFATPDGQVKYGYVSGECTLLPNTVYMFNLDTKVSKAGKNYTVIAGIVDAQGTPVAIAAKAKGDYNKGGGRYDSEGMAKGNLRQCTAQYICACVSKGTQPNIPGFVAFLQQAEAIMFPKVATPAQAPAVTPAVAPASQATPVASAQNQAPLI